MFRNSVEYIPPFCRETKDKVYVAETPFDLSLYMTTTVLMYKRWPEFKIFDRLYTNANPEDYNGYVDVDDSRISFEWFSNAKCPDEYLTGNFVTFPKHEAFFAEKLGQKVYFRLFSEYNTVCIYAERVNYELYHLAQSFFTQFFGKFFEEYPRTKEETDMLMALSNRTETAYKKAVQNALENEELRTYLLRSRLLGFERTLKEKKHERAMAKVNEFEDKMNQARQTYSEYYAKREEARIYADGILYSLERTDDATEFEEYLCSNKNLTNININGEHIQFIVKTFVNPYLPDDWDNLRRRGAIFEDYDKVGNNLDVKENLAMLLDAIFSREHPLKLKICAFFDMNLSNSEIHSHRNYPYIDANPVLKNYVPNMHLNKYDCFGQNLGDILTQINDSDLVGAVECCINVAKRMNVSESASFRPFVMELKKCKGKCIVGPDGQEMTTKEALAFLKGENDEEVSDEDGEAGVA